MALIVLLLVICFWLNPTAESKDGQAVTALRLRQKHYFFGDTELLVSKVGFRAESTSRLKFKVVAKAPTWTVTVYRDDDKTYYQETIDKFKDTGLVSGILLSYREREVYPEVIPQKVELFKFPAILLKAKSGTFSYMPIDQYGAPQIQDLVHACYKLPVNGGVPLQYWRRQHGKDMITELDETGNMQVFLNTIKISKVTVAPTIFDAPANYRKTKTMGEVVISASKRNESEDFQQIFGRDEEPKRK